MFCPKCGSAVVPGSRFCGACGSQIAMFEQPAAPVDPTGVTPGPAKRGLNSPLYGTVKASLIGLVVAVAVAIVLSFAGRFAVIAFSEHYLQTVFDSVSGEMNDDEARLAESYINAYAETVDEVSPSAFGYWTLSHGAGWDASIEVSALGETSDGEFSGLTPMSPWALVPLLALMAGIGVSHLVQRDGTPWTTLTRIALVVLGYAVIVVLVGAVSFAGERDLSDTIRRATEQIVESVSSETEIPDELTETIDDMEASMKLSAHPVGQGLGAALIGVLAALMVTPMRRVRTARTPQARQETLSRAVSTAKSVIWAAVLCSVLAVIIGVGVMASLEDDFITQVSDDYEEITRAPGAGVLLTQSVAVLAPELFAATGVAAHGGELAYSVELLDEKSRDSASLFDGLDDSDNRRYALMLLAPLISIALLTFAACVRARCLSAVETVTWAAVFVVAYTGLQILLVAATRMAVAFEVSGLTMRFDVGFDTAASAMPVLGFAIVGGALGAACYGVFTLPGVRSQRSGAPGGPPVSASVV